MKKLIVCILSLLMLIEGFGKINLCAMNDSSLHALSAVIIDGENGRVLYSKDGDTIRPMASTTKIMTLIIALEYGNCEDIITVSAYAARMPDVQLGISENEQYKLEDLMYSMMLESHNDSAVAIAEHIGGSVEGFANMMNQKAMELGLTSTYFITPNGLDAKNEGGVHATTAKELARIMKYCIKDSEKKDAFIRICQTRQYSFEEYSGKRSFTVYNKNAFLDMEEGVLAGKTGFTADAGYCYVCAVERDGKTLIIALLGCGWPNNKGYKWKDTRALLEYAGTAFCYRGLIGTETELPDVSVENAIEKERTSLHIKDEYSALISENDNVEILFDIPKSIDAPVCKNEEVGTLVLKINNEEVWTTSVYISEDVMENTYKYHVNKIFDCFIKCAVQ